MPTTRPRTRKTVVFVPGLGATGAVYQPLLDALGRHYDIRHADPGPGLPDKLDWDFFFRAIEQVAPKGQFTLLGHSLGGAVVLRYASMYPDRVSKVVAVAPVLFPFKRKKDPWRKLRSAWLSLRGAGLGHLLEAVKIRHMLLGGGKAGKLYDWAGAIDLSATLPKVRRATVLQPVKEEIIPLTHFKRVRREFPGIKMRYVAGTHNNLALYPDPLLHAVRQELRG